MTPATLRCAGAVSSSGRTYITPANLVEHNLSFKRLSARRLVAPFGSRVSVSRQASDGNEFRSAPSLTDGLPSEQPPPETSVGSAPVNTSNYSAIAALASVGMLETAYLAYVKIFDGPLVCPTNGCESVLNSPYAQLFGLPLPIFGMLTYGTVGALAATYVRQSKDNAPTAARQATLLALTSGVAALATTSAVLISILQTRLGGTPCVWCYLSAALSIAAAVTLGSSMTAQQMKDNALASVGAAAATAALLYTGWPASSAGAVYDENFSLEYQAPVISTVSSDRALALAARLKAAGARMYGAFWCSHCAEQKQVFGASAMADFPYVECFPNGWKRGEPLAPLCESAGVKAFPTWVIGGKTVEGELTLDEVERELSRVEQGAGEEGGQVEVAA